ncbi:hypothetical protein [Parabacteroides sp. AM08-6]|uniref:hypothetical protein n=1 Tax=Parabacteroides sp. AM08-6 TaxID=2292053 RepID=UPI000EFF3385|nr:hypothetical protein [Parabacteroides sp. AM08-6]RHJ76135.1 hypothetical protein DW103_17270 [Parabacteroides sp. AM08-6]
MITIEEANILLGEIAYHDTVERVNSGFKFTTTAEFSGTCREAYITDEQIDMAVDGRSVHSELAQNRAIDFVRDNL